MNFDRVTAPKAKTNKEYLKGRYIFDQTDVMQLPILELNEQAVKLAYGKDKLMKQDISKLAISDEFSNKLLYN